MEFNRDWNAWGLFVDGYWQLHCREGLEGHGYTICPKSHSYPNGWVRVVVSLSLDGSVCVERAE